MATISHVMAQVGDSNLGMVGFEVSLDHLAFCPVQVNPSYDIYFAFLFTNCNLHASIQFVYICNGPRLTCVPDWLTRGLCVKGLLYYTYPGYLPLDTYPPPYLPLDTYPIQILLPQKDMGPTPERDLGPETPTPERDLVPEIPIPSRTEWQTSVKTLTLKEVRITVTFSRQKVSK